MKLKQILFGVLLSYSMLFSYDYKDNDFNPSAELNWRTADFGIKASNYVYSDGLANLDVFMENNGFQKLQEIDEKEYVTVFDSSHIGGTDEIVADVQASIYKKRITIDGKQKNLIVIVFRGTDELNDWRTDAEFSFATWDFTKTSKIMVHQGFLASMFVFENHLKNEVTRELVSKDNIVFLTGHSLGGALATMFSAKLLQNYGKSKKNILTYTYGAPGFANKAFYQKFANTFFLHRIYNKKDSVTNITNVFFRLNGGFQFSDGGHSSSKYYMPKIETMKNIYNLNYVYSWNGNASIINYLNDGISYDDNNFGIKYDISRTDNLTPKNSFNSFQWQVNTNNGKNLKISDNNGKMTRAQICYSSWASSEKKFCRSVNLPYIIDPNLDGYTVEDGKWFIIGIRNINDSNSISELKAEPTDEESSYITPQKLSMNINGTHIWTGTGSLIDKSTGTSTDFGANNDVAFMIKDLGNNFGDSTLPVKLNSVVFFQWQVGDSGKKVKISSNCATYATITLGYWYTRQRDVVINRVKLPYTIDPSKLDKNVKPGEWRVIKVAVDETRSNGDTCSYGKARIYANIVGN